MKTKNIYSFSAMLVLFVALSMSACRTTESVQINSMSSEVSNCVVPYTVYFSADVEESGRPLQYLWDFGDDETSSEIEPVHTYQATGVYDVQLTVRDKKTSSVKSTSLNLSLPVNPVDPDFVIEYTNENNRVLCQLELDNNTNFASVFEWYLDDKLISNQRDPIQMIDKPGNYELKLVASCNGDTQFVAMPLVVYPPPTDLLVGTVSVWLPSEYNDSYVDLDILYNGNKESGTGSPILADDDPVVFYINKDLFFFDDSFDFDEIRFEIWDQDDFWQPIYSFSTTTRELYDNFYPTEVSWDKSNGFAAKVTFKYR